MSEVELDKMNKKAILMKDVFEQMFIRMQQLSADCLAVSSGDLTKNDLMLIDYIGTEKTCIMKNVAEHLNAPLSTLTSMIDKLVKKKQLKRDRSDEDRRIVEVMLADQGKLTYKEFNDSKLIMSYTMMSALEEDEQDEFIRLLQKIAEKAKKVD